MATLDATQEALAKLNVACLQMALAAQTLDKIRDGHPAGIDCACDDGCPCAYHAGLITTLDDVRRRAMSVEQELQGDVKNPARKH